MGYFDGRIAVEEGEEMDCPVCREPMVVLELDKVEIDHCFSCGGIWLDSGELELLLEDSKEKESLMASFEKNREAKEKARKCPICLKIMEKVTCGLEKKTLVDKCRQNDGIWFDKGELEEVLRRGSFDKDNKVLGLLRDMFGKRQQA
ncbi:MAG: zf-TFIIB domain-containing protein [Candidatus Omnitrophica bacterium]|nr:zf-TFIIB domain-containing protein [Candidatus Omnitrophota bacterium]